MTTEELARADQAVVDDMNRLLAQLHEGKEGGGTTLAEVEYMIQSPDIALAVVKDSEKVIGMATLLVMHKLEKATGYVEDVVVDSAYRGQGLGEKVMQKLIELARARGLESLSLTSRPSRVAGNKLYQKLGFEMRDTNVYKLSL